MRLFTPSRLASLCGACLFLFGSPVSAREPNFDLDGAVLFTNVQKGLFSNGLVPYYGIGTSDLTGPNVQTGSIRRTSPLMPDDPISPTKLTFTGTVGPHPLLPFGPEIHIISTADGQIICTWTATFTITFTSATEGVFSGDGEFTVIGGTGKYRKASGEFRTLFATGPIPLSSDSAIADVTQEGTINRK